MDQNTTISGIGGVFGGLGGLADQIFGGLAGMAQWDLAMFKLDNESELSKDKFAAAMQAIKTEEQLAVEKAKNQMQIDMMRGFDGSEFETRNSYAYGETANV